MFNLNPAEISAYGAFILAILVPMGQFILSRFKNNDSRNDKEFADGIEIRKELRKENERLNNVIQNQELYYRSELSKRDEAINKIKDEKFGVEIKLSTALEKIEVFKDKVLAEGEKVIEQIKIDTQSSI